MLENRLLKTDRLFTNQMITSKSFVPRRLPTMRTPSGKTPKTSKKFDGASTKATRWPGLIPSFLESGVPE